MMTVRHMKSSTPVTMPPVRSSATPAAEWVPPPNITCAGQVRSGQVRSDQVKSGRTKRRVIQHAVAREAGGVETLVSNPTGQTWVKHGSNAVHTWVKLTMRKVMTNSRMLASRLNLKDR